MTASQLTKISYLIVKAKVILPKLSISYNTVKNGQKIAIVCITSIHWKIILQPL